jgi:hypothetical protein
MKKITITTDVHNGKIKRNRNLVLEAIQSFEGKTINITIERQTKKRSNSQNAYYHGVLIPILKNCIKDSWGEVWSSERCHEFCKMQFNFYEKINEKTGEIIRLPKSTTENTTTAQEEYHHEIRNFIKEWFNVDCPLPNQEILLNFNE